VITILTAKRSEEFRVKQIHLVLNITTYVRSALTSTGSIKRRLARGAVTGVQGVPLIYARTGILKRAFTGGCTRFAVIASRKRER
jgi:hypothetical protein